MKQKYSYHYAIGEATIRIKIKSTQTYTIQNQLKPFTKRVHDFYHNGLNVQPFNPPNKSGRSDLFAYILQLFILSV